MKKLMKNTAKFLAFVFGLAAAQAFANGDIYELRPCLEDGTVVAADYYASAANPVTSGDVDLYFMVRLIEAKYDGTTHKPWYLKPSSLAVANPDVYSSAAFWPSVSVVVGNELRTAEMVAANPRMDSYGNFTGFTDLIFKFTTKTGDIALPCVVLALADGSPANVASGSSGVPTYEFKLNPSAYWTISNDDSTSLSFSMYEVDSSEMSAGNRRALLTGPDGDALSDYTLAGCNFYVKTVQFNGEVEGQTTPWRTIHEGGTEPIEAEKSEKMCLTTVGSALSEGEFTYYVWVDDESKAYVHSIAGAAVVPTDTFLESDGTTVTKHVGKVTLSGSTSESDTIAIYGVTAGTSCNLVLSPWPQYRANAANTILTDTYKTIPIAVTDRKPSSIEMTVTKNVTATSDYLKYVGVVTVKWSDDQYPNAVAVTVTPEFTDADDAASGAVWTDYFRIATTVDSTTSRADELPTAAESAAALNFSLAAGDTVGKTFYILALTADDKTRSSSHHFALSLAADATDFPEQTESGRLPSAKPLYIDAEEPSVYVTPFGPRQGDPANLSVLVTNVYADTEDTATGYEVRYYPDIREDSYSTLDGKYAMSPSLKKLVKLDTAGAYTSTLPTYTYNVTGVVTSRVEVVSPITGLTGAYDFEVIVRPVRSATLAADAATYDEGDQMTFTVNISEKHSSEKLYAFLRVTKQDGADLTDTECFGDSKCVITADSMVANTSGWEVDAGSTAIYVPAQDGTAETKNLRFTLVLATSQVYSSATDVTSRYKLGDATYPSPLVATINNLAPVIPSDVTKAGFTVNNYTLKNYIDADGVPYLPKNLIPGEKLRIKPDITDAEYDMTHSFTWTITASHHSSDASNTAEPPDPITIPSTTTSIPAYSDLELPGGKWNVTIFATDKDGDVSINYTFWVNVVKESDIKLSVAPSAETIDETETHATIDVTLPYYDKQNLLVKLTVTPPKTGLLKLDSTYKETPHAGYADLDENEYYILFRGSGTESIAITELDGTVLTEGQGFTLQAEVVTTNDYDKASQAWNAYYAKSALTRVYVNNVTPEFGNCSVPNSETNAYKVAGGSANPIKWAVALRSECQFDKTNEWTTAVNGSNVTTNGIKVTIDGCRNAAVFFASDTYPGDNFYPVFGSDALGVQTVTVSIEDKDGGSPEQLTYYYEIQAAKFLTTVASGPSTGNAAIPISVKYANAAGVGEGHVWVSGGTFNGTEGFFTEWNCNLATKFIAYAFGYPVGAIDNGTLNGEKDVWVDSNGNRNANATAPATGSYYEYGDEYYDSFFYGFIRATEPGGESYIIDYAPQTGTNNEYKAQYNLPGEMTDDEVGYPQTYIEAVFSREYSRYDNMGDINNDGVPDIYAKYEYSNGALSSFDGAAGELPAVNTKNDDADFFPTSSHIGETATAPGAVSGWETSGQAYTALYEIRGYDDGLNYGMFKFNQTERKAGWVSDIEMSDLEKHAFMREIFKRRDALLNKLYTTQLTSDGNTREPYELDLITNFLAHVYFAGASRASGQTRFYMTDDDIAAYTNYLEVVTTNVEDEVTTIVTNLVNAWIRTYRLPYAEEDTVITNFYGEAVSNTLTGVLHTPNPSESLSFDAVDYGALFNYDFNGEWQEQQKWAKLWIDYTWRNFELAKTWGFTVENRTDPTVEDTDGDGMPDGYEYYMWYSAMVGTGTNEMTGCRFNLADVESYDDIITAEDIRALYNPNIAHSWTKTDTDNDGLYDLEEFLIGTSPVHWDTDRDGLSDLYEVVYNINPMSAAVGSNGAYNGDGDFMAFRKNPDGYTYSIYAVDNNGTQELWAIYSIDPVEIDTNQTTQVVTGRGCKVAMLAGNYIPVTENTTSNNLVTTVRKEVLTSVAVTNAPLTLYHYQVKKYFGFDPRTGWYSDGAGYATSRYGVKSAGEAQNTTGYTAINEFLLMKYRYIVGLENATTDQENIKAGKTTMYNIILARTTNPSPDFSDKTWGDSETVRAQTQHGADTDGDAVPDGWELYMGVSPNHKFTIARGSPGYDALYWGSGQNAAMNFVRPGTGEIAAGDSSYTDGMSLAREYAGTDSCGKYSDCASIYANHPSQTGSVVEKWFNKFFPTDPYDDDTDGDGLNDGAEGRDWTGAYTINRWGQDGNRSKDNLTIGGVTFHMFYGNPSDTGSTCIAGGGYNPCSIDTDADALPDLWEHQYTGLVFKNDEIMTEANSGEGNLVFPRTTGVPGDVYDDIRAATAALGWWEKNITNDVWHIVMGMDGTVADAYSETGLTSSDRDWDGDGLQNYQEYLVQAMRHLRYDDWKTPLMGRDISSFNRYTGEYEDGSWNGDRGFLKISYSEPVSTDAYSTLEELGYKNFVAYIKDNNNYLRELGYFAAPPRDWDYVSSAGLGYYYMLPPTCSKPAAVTSSTNWTPAQDDNLDLLWGYAQPADYETGYILKDDYAGTPFAGDIPTEIYDPAYVYPDGTILYCTNDSDVVSVVVENDPDDPSIVYLDRVLLLASKVETVYHVSSNLTYTASGYVGTDPRLWDTDEDGMDDYYEIFHGLNPILGSVGTINTTTVTNYDGSTLSVYSASDVKDVIADAYGNVSGMRNGWVGWENAERPAYDPIRFPWMMGEGMCDADGDGLRNNEEALSANLTAPNTYHTDPTPLWMTDATGSETNYAYTVTVVTTNVDKTVSWRDPATGERVYGTSVSTNTHTAGYVALVDTPSYVGLYYDNFLSGYYASLSTASAFLHYGANLFSFEENEGYDSDNDWRSDDVEMRKTVEKTSDPQNAVDLPRRQSIWFGGASEPGVALTYEDSRRSTYGYDLFKQFTVEAWVRPEEPSTGADQYIVSRASNYAGWDYANSNSVIRMNFALGVDASGNLFGEMQNSTDSSFRLTAGAAEANVWTHLAATFDGTTFRVYVNGAEAASMPTKLIPANGVIGVQQDPQFGTAFPYEHFSYDAVPGITILGGRAAGADAFDVQLAGNASSWNGIATDFFKGSVAEVRFWDGARTAEDILADRDVRFTAASVKALRDAVYDQFRYGARRTYGNLDPELIQHYGFDSLPGATEKGYVVQEPAGFASDVLGSVRNPDTGATISDSLKVGWWSKIAENTAVGSVYSSPHVVPWIENTVAHLPTLCGSVADSVFWSENFAGYTPSEFHLDGSDNPLSKFDIVNTMNPYNLVSLHDEEANLRRKLYRVSLSAYAGGGNIPDGQSVTNNATYRKYLYDTRMAFNGVTDLVPLGSAFAKRLTESWDGEGPEDAWTRTTDGNSREGDLADNGIPQWAIDAGYTTEEDYLVALADGLLPDGAKDITYTRDYYFNELAKKHFYDDENGNEIPDWWERYFGIYDCDKNGDEDNDGLSNYQEFLISFGDYSVTTTTDGWSVISKIARNVGMPFLSPVDAHSTGEAVVDYFLKPDFDKMTDSRLTKNTYLGEMVTDHDKMEMWWELKNNTAYSNAFAYDPHFDKDEDGWSNFAEARGYSWYGGFTSDIIDRYFSADEDYHEKSFPTPAIGVTATYNGIQDISGKSLVVRTSTQPGKRIDATFMFAGADKITEGTTLLVNHYNGTYAGDTMVHGFLHPGKLVPSADILIIRRPINDANIYQWSLRIGSASIAKQGLAVAYYRDLMIYGRRNVTLQSMIPLEYILAAAEADIDGRIGYFVSTVSNEVTHLVSSITIGKIDYLTGEYEFNPALAAEIGKEVDDSVYTIDYTYMLGAEWPQTVWLSDTSKSNGEQAQGYGRIKEGKNTVEAFMDLNGNGTYDIGEPYGALRDVEIGWHKTGEPLVIELTDDSTIVKRTAIATETSSNTNEAETVTEGLTTSIVVRRSAINGDTSIGRRLSSSTIVLDDRAYVTEADILGSATSEGLDLDWKWLSVDAANKLGNAADVRNATYEILLQGEESPIATFSRTFSSSRGKAQILAPVTSAPVYSARPTVTFACDDETMTAYCLQIATSASEGDVIWSSGTKRLPGRTPYSTDKRAVYAVTPEIYVDTFATTNGTPVFADGGKYYARVALMNSKFNNTDDENCWSAWAEFQMDVANALQNPDTQTGYGNVAAAVRYYGAGAVTDLSGVSNVVVEAYNTADFTGAPVARTRLASIEGIDSASDVTTTNAVMSGIAPGTVYLMAYIDSNNNGKRDAWESWGYANRIGEDTKFLYTPKGVEVTDANYMYQSATIYIEDADLNQNEIPDILEGPVSQSEEDDPALVDSDGDGLMDVDETDYYGTNPYDADTDDDGIPDGYEVATGSDPLTADADTAGKGDYMAYAEVEAYVFETNGVAYVLNVDKGLAYETAAIGGANGTLVATSLVDGFSLADIAGTVTNAFSKRSVVLVHSAVYDWFGYDSTTARDPATLDVSLDGESTNDVSTVLGPNTVPFSAFWKYFTTEFYLPAHGVELDEPMTVASLDYEANGLPDGWELYVKYVAGEAYDGAAASAAFRSCYDPYDEYYFYKQLDASVASTIPAFTNAEAFEYGFVGEDGTLLAADEEWWSVAQAEDYAAYVETNVQVAIVRDAEGNASVYAYRPGTTELYETFEVGGLIYVGAPAGEVDTTGFHTIVTNAAVVHSAVYDWYGFDITTARPSFFVRNIDGEDAEATSNQVAAVGANSVPFSRRLKYVTTKLYLPLVGDDNYDLMSWDTDTNSNDLPDGWELYVKYAAGSDPDKTDDEYRDDFIDGTDPTAEDTDGDGIPDNEEREIGTDPRTPDADTALEGDVMAYAELKRPVVTFEGMCGEGMREVVIMEGTVPSVGQIVNAAAAANLTMRNAYVYGTQSNYVWGVGMEFTVADGEVWRVLEVRSSETVALVHSQVYDAYGFNPRTANATVSSNEWASVNSKAFTALDKTLVTRYFQAIGMTAEADDWKKYALKADTVDSNGDGIADGWELYVMFGPSGTDSAAGTSPADAKISPWMSAAEANNPGYTPDGGGLAVVDEYDEGNSPTDPWSVYSLDSTIDDRYLKLYHLKGDDAGSDYDGDGLSNYAEYLISEVFHFADVDPENPTSGDGTLDYFKKFGELYLGELFSDHDQTGDGWEAKYEAGDIDGVDYAARGIFNPSLDLDRDGWSNYAEYRAGTDPSVSVAPAFDSYKTVEYPVPVVELDLVYNGSLPDGTITVKAWSDESDVNGGYALGAPDAVWTISSNGTANAESEKFIGLKPEGVRTYYLGPGGVKAGTFKLCVMDRNFVTGTMELSESGQYVPTITGYGKASDAKWYVIAIDHNGEIRSSGGRFGEDATFGTIDSKTGRVTLDFSNELFEQMLIGSGDDVYGETTGNTTTSDTYDFLDLENAYVMLAWEPAGVSGGITGKYFLSDATGHLREGKNTFTIEVDTEQADTDQVSTLTSRASLYAVVRGVDVGWAGARVKAELTDFSPVTPRIDLWRPVADRTESVVTNDMRVYASEPSNRVNRTVASSARERVRVVRYAINGYPSQQSWGDSAKVVYDRYRLNTGRTDLTELDFLSDGEFDIDWDTFRSEIVVPTRITSRTGMVTNMCYLVVFGEGDTGWRDSGSGNTVNAHTALITRRFDRERVAANDLKVDGTQYGARPTFSWRIDAENPYTAQYGSSYTAFQLVIQNTGDAVVYDSGIQRMPVRNAAGEYVWTAPVCVGDLAVAAPYAPAGHFYARVMLYNAKFNESDSYYWSDSVQFSTAVGQQQEINDHGYSSIKAAVKYAGHSVVLKKYADLATLLGKVRVQAFPTADFTGEPLASAVVTNAVDAIADNAPNAVLRGLAANGSYYIRAFIDMDGDGKLSDFEPWGCCKTPVVLSASLQSAPVVGVWMEDADTDGDWYPDAYEYATYDGWASGESLGGTVWDDIKGNRVTATKLGVLQQTTIDGEDVVYLLKDGAATTNAISGSLPGVSLTALQTKKYVQMLFNGVLAQNNITDINEAAKARITPDSLKITSMVLDRESKKVVMTVNAEVASSIAGTVVAKYFYFKGSDAKKVNVTVEVYKKNTLMDAEWKLVASVPKTIESDKDDIVEVPLGDEIDLSSGFFKVEAVEADAGE